MASDHTDPSSERQPSGFESFSLLTLPEEVRQSIYDQVLPQGLAISLRINAHQSSLPQLYSLARTCRKLHQEIVHQYIGVRPFLLHASYGRRLTILNRIPRHIRLRITILVIEDEPSEPEWPLLPNLEQICLVDSYETKIFLNNQTFPDHPHNLTLPSTPSKHRPYTENFYPMGMTELGNLSIDDLREPTPPPIQLAYPPPPASCLPRHNAVLRDAQIFWKRCRLNNPWIRDLANGTHPINRRIRFILRRAIEAEVVFDRGTSGRDANNTNNSVSAANSNGATDASPRANLEAPDDDSPSLPTPSPYRTSPSQTVHQDSGSAHPSTTTTTTTTTKPSNNNKLIVGWHSIVDVSTTSVIESSWLPERRVSSTRSGPQSSQKQQESAHSAGQHHADYVFPYAVMASWWRGRDDKA